MLRLLALGCLWAPPAYAIDSEWKISLIGALELPGLASQSPTDFDLATWATGVGASHGVLDWLHLGGRVVYSQVSGAVQDYANTDANGTRFEGTLNVDMSAWRTEAVAQVRLLRGMAIEPQLTLAGGYTWTVYNNPTLDVSGGQVDVAAGSEDFAEGTPTASAALSVDWRILPFLEVSAGAELSRYFDGLYESAIRFPITVTGVFWGPM